MLQIKGILALSISSLLLTACANSTYIPAGDDGPAFNVITYVSDDDLLVSPRFSHRSKNLFPPRACIGQNKDPLHFLDPEASCNKYLIEGSGAGNTIFGLGLAIASGNLSAYRGSLATMAATEIAIPGVTGEVPDYLKNLTDQQKEVAVRHQAFKAPSDAFIEEHPESLGAWYMSYVAHRSDDPWQSTYLFGYLPLDYASTPEAVIKRLESEMYLSAKMLLEKRGYKLDESNVANPLVRTSRHGFRGIFGNQCPSFNEGLTSDNPEAWQDYAANTNRTPCLLLLSTGYGNDSRIHEAGGYSNFPLTKADISDLVQKIKLPQRGLPPQLHALAGKTVWKIAPEYAYDDLKFAVFFPLGKQIDLESFYREFSNAMPEGMFLHVAHSPGLPIWTSEDLIIRGVPYLLHNGSEIAYVPKHLLNN